MRTVFFGTPLFAVPCLETLAGISEIARVYCQPDRKVGRGLKLAPPPVKARALELGLDVAQPTKLKDGEVARWIASRAIDVAVVVAYGRILPADILEAPKMGCVNVHASILPRLRGAAPITWSIVRGDEVTGVTIMKMDEGMDTGPVIGTFELPIEPNETAGELGERLSALGARALGETLPPYVAGEKQPTPQDHTRATHAPLLTKQDGHIDFSGSPKSVHDRIRGMNPWPGAHAHLGDRTVKIHRARPLLAMNAHGKRGEVIVCDPTRVVVACDEGAIELIEIQLPGKKPMPAGAWVTGRGVRAGDVLY